MKCGLIYLDSTPFSKLDYKERAEEIQNQLNLARQAFDDIPQNRTIICSGGSLTVSSLSNCFSILEGEGYKIDTIFVSPRCHGDIRCWDRLYLEYNDSLYAEATGTDKRIWGADIYVDRHLPNNTVITCGSILDNQNTENLTFARIMI